MIKTIVEGDMETDVDETAAEKFMLPKENGPMSVMVLSGLACSCENKKSDALPANRKNMNDTIRRACTDSVYFLANVPDDQLPLASGHSLRKQDV